MKTICIIGLGTISRNHRYGLTNNKYFRLAGACDISEDASGRADYAGVPFFRDYRQMVGQLGPDYVVIATPPRIHARIAVDVLNMGSSVLIEKPTALSVKELELINETALGCNLYCETVFHWQYGYEVLYTVENIGKYGKVKKVSASINDPYSRDGISINSGNTGLCGTFLDAGSNAISFLYRILDFEKFRLTESGYIDDPVTGFPVWSHHLFQHDGIEAEIEVDWRKNINKKISRIYFDNGSEMTVDHSGQSVIYGNRPVFSNTELNRLTAHYYNYYNLFSPSAERSRELFDISMKITKIWEGKNDAK